MEMAPTKQKAGHVFSPASTARTPPSRSPRISKPPKTDGKPLDKLKPPEDVNGFSAVFFNSIQI
jgi:hypothetical protein